MSKVLLFNFTSEDRRKKVKAVLFRYGIPSREVPPAEQGRMIGALLGLEGFEEGKETGTPFPEEMIVMHQLDRRQFQGFLDGIRALGVQVPLKAVVTENNIRWSAGALQRELKAEHAAMSGKRKG